MYDSINPTDFTSSIFDGERCQKCDELHYEESLVAVWTSIENYQSWCEVCARNHATEHPIIKNELWAIGSTDTENNLTIK
jgi:hypothetical protein